VSEVLRSLDDKVCAEILNLVSATRPDLVVILRVAMEAPLADAEDIASLLRPDEATWALNVAGRVLVRHGRMA